MFHLSLVIGLPREIRQLADISLGALVNRKVELKAGAIIAIPIAKRIGSGNLLSHFVFGLGGE
jgi:hypothetical protein